MFGKLFKKSQKTKVVNKDDRALVFKKSFYTDVPTYIVEKFRKEVRKFIDDRYDAISEYYRTHQAIYLNSALNDSLDVIAVLEFNEICHNCNLKAVDFLKRAIYTTILKYSDSPSVEIDGEEYKIKLDTDDVYMFFRLSSLFLSLHSNNEDIRSIINQYNVYISTL